MSSSIDINNTIYLTRGDTLKARLTIHNGDEKYVPQEGDIIRFAAKHATLNKKKTEFVDPTPLILKTIPNDSLILTINPEDTKKLPFGAYVYDVEITFADGDVDTIITASPFFITEEVH